MAWWPSGGDRGGVEDDVRRASPFLASQAPLVDGEPRARWSLYRSLMPPDAWLLVAALLLVSVSWLIEWRTETIPNWLVAVGLVAGVVAAMVDHRPGQHLTAFAVATVVCLMGWLGGVVGGGAMKMTIVVCALLGGAPGLRYLAICGGIFGLMVGQARWRGVDASMRSSPIMFAAVLTQAAVAW